jgi:biotin transport system substrate-specific component
MNHPLSFSQPTPSALFSDTTPFKKLAILLAGVFILAAASQFIIPLQPIPLTFQSATVILIAMVYGSKNGSYVIAAYLFAGLCGLPVFAHFTFGPAKFMSPTTGYLVGFLPAAYISGYLAEHGWGRNILSSFAASMIGAAIIFACGISVLATFTDWDNAVTSGLLPYIISEPIKLAVLSLIIPRLWK